MGFGRRSRCARSVWLVCALLVACSGRITQSGTPADPLSPGSAGPFGGSGAGASAPGGGAASDPNGSNGSSSGGGTGGSALEEPAPSTRAARLTHAQWQRTVEDLLYLEDDSAFTTMLRADPVQNGFPFDNNSLTLSVDEALFTGYETAAAQLAELVTGDPARLAKIVPAEGGDDAARAEAFVRDFGLRAHRRPLTAQEQSEYLALFQMGPALYTGLSDFEAGVRVVLEAMLQSPYFLYRIEESSDEVDGAIPLDGYELASRLSYALWGSMPDDALFAAAADDSLLDRAELEREARRMLADPRAEAVVQDFHEQLFEAQRFASVRPSPAFFPDVPADLGASATTEFDMFVSDQVLKRAGSYADLLTSKDTFVNQDLADVYGLSGSYGSDFVPASLDPAQRKGILTQVGFLAGNATSVNPDPIHRGVFLARRITCTQIAAPPANIPPLPTPPAGQTNRKTIEDLTQDPDTICASCHASIINPFGFPFESYDAIGGFRTTDADQPVDTHSTPALDGMQQSVGGALELIDALAESPAVHACYAQHLLEYLYARPTTDEDSGLLANLSAQSLSAAPVEDLIVSLVTSRAFTLRSPQELP